LLIVNMATNVPVGPTAARDWQERLGRRMAKTVPFDLPVDNQLMDVALYL
jgi:hypothetical protein